jgi:predicted metalloprotease
MANWGKITSRGDVEDRRGMSPAAIGGGLGLTGVIVTLAISLLTGADPNSINDVLTQLQGTQGLQQQQTQPSEFAGPDKYETFASEVLGSNNDLWKKVFSDNGLTYHEPKLVLFRTSTQSACGGATSAVGPHYCPLDKTIYLDETFFDELRSQFGAEGGDVAEGYVIAHEAGHHVQNELGTMEKVQSAGDSNQLSVKLELQADCYAGIWAKSVENAGVVGPGEIQEATDAAAAVGDDRIQKKVQGQITPETWTHGSSAQRVQWFNTGYNTGAPDKCNTFQ